MVCSHLFVWTAALLVLISSVGWSLRSDIEDISRSLDEEFLHKSQQCGGWQDKYSALHRKTLQSDDPRILVAVPHISGMADRIIGFTTVFLVAVLSDKAFQMGRREHLPVFEDAFLSRNINWTRPLDADWLMQPLSLRAERRNYNKSTLLSRQYWAVNTLDDYRYLDRLVTENLHILMRKDTKTVLMISNRGKTIHMYNNRFHQQQLQEMGMTRYSTFGCLVNFLLQPKSEIFLPFLPEFKAMTDRDPSVLKISIQIRVGDSVWDSAASTEQHQRNILGQFKHFFSCAKQIEEFALKEGAYSSVRWFLATDSQPLRIAAAQKYGSKIFTSINATLEHSAKEFCPTASSSDNSTSPGCAVSSNGFKSAAAEWWLIGYADYHVITRFSGYGRSGAFRTIQSDRVYTVHNAPVKCDAGSFTPLEEIMYDWSGI